VTRSRSRGGTLLIDTNLLVLLLVGALDLEQVEKFRRTRAYTREDYALLASFVAGYSRMLTTPNVLTEVSNLVGQLAEPLRRRALVALGILTTEQFQEHAKASKELVIDRHFPVLGLADTSIIDAAGKGVTVLTDDLGLYARLSSAGGDVINFNHIRSGAWQ